MNELPDLVLCKFLQMLDLPDKLRCRRVSKRFFLLIDSLPSKELIIRTDFWFQVQRWFDNFKITNRRNSICVWGDPKLFQSNLLASRYFENLKKLHFEFSSHGFEGRELHFSLSFLNNFTQLRTLFIRLSNKPYFSYNCKEPIVLKNLVNLYLDLSYLSEIEVDRLQLNCENLNYLELQPYCWPLFDILQLVYRNQIGHIRISSSNFEDNLEFLKTLKGVRELDCHMDDLSDIPLLIGLIDEYKELKTLSVRAVQRFDGTKWADLNVEAIEQLRRHMDTVRADVELYLNGLLSKHFDKLKRFFQNGCTESKLEFYLQNHLSTSKFLREFRFLAYDRWEPLELRGQIPRGFLQKLVNLCSITVKGKVNDPNRLVQFLSECELIETLRLINSSLDQTFYSRLSSYLPYLADLEIEDDPVLLESLNFNFVFEFNYFYYLKLKRPLDLDLAYRLFMENIYPQLIDFTIDGRPACLARQDSESFRQNDPTEVDNANLKAWVKKLNDDYNEKYGDLLSTCFKLPVIFVISYRDVPIPDI